MPLAPMAYKTRSYVCNAAVAVARLAEFMHEINKEIYQSVVGIIGAYTAAVTVIGQLLDAHIPYELRHGLVTELVRGVVEVNTEHRLIAS